MPILEDKSRSTEPAQETMSCMEVWGGNSETWSSFVMPGLDIWVYNHAYGESDRGGDVYYLSSCASGRVTRMFLGDVSGHGAEAAPLASKLRDIMRKNVNFIDQSRVINSLNEEFEQASSQDRFATAIVSTYFSPTRELSVCTAGHPPPLIYRAVTDIWDPLEPNNPALQNLPFGVMNGQNYSSTKFKLQTGDIVMGYSDALYEAKTANGDLLSSEGLATIANSLDAGEPGDFVERLLECIRNLSPENLTFDDATVVLARANEQNVALKDNLLAPFRFIGDLLGL